MALITRKSIMTERDRFWAYAHKIKMGRRIITVWCPSLTMGVTLHFLVDGDGVDTRVSISAFDVCVFGKNGTYKTIDVHSFPSLITEEGLYRLCNWLSAEGLL